MRYKGWRSREPSVERRIDCGIVLATGGLESATGLPPTQSLSGYLLLTWLCSQLVLASQSDGDLLKPTTGTWLMWYVCVCHVNRRWEQARVGVIVRIFNCSKPMICIFYGTLSSAKMSTGCCLVSSYSSLVAVCMCVLMYITKLVSKDPNARDIIPLMI